MEGYVEMLNKPLGILCEIMLRAGCSSYPIRITTCASVYGCETECIACRETNLSDYELKLQ